MSFVWLIITEYRLGWRLLGWASWSKMKGAFRGTWVALGVEQKLKPGFPMFVGCCLWGLFLYLLSSSRFKKSVLLPSTVYGVVSLLSKRCLRSLFQDFSLSLAACLLFACVPFTGQFRWPDTRGLCLLLAHTRCATWVFYQRCYFPLLSVFAER